MDRRKEIKAVEHQSDIETVVRLADLIWREHYTAIIGKAQVDYMLDKFQSTAAIKEQIRDGASYYLIEYEEQPVGYFSYYLKDDGLFLSKIYVQSSLRGKGLGRTAIQFLEEKAKEYRVPKISLTVNKNNSRTIAAYEKIGFRKIKPLVIDIGGGFVMDDFYMEKTIAIP